MHCINGDDGINFNFRDEFSSIRMYLNTIISKLSGVGPNFIRISENERDRLFGWEPEDH
jgi:hypothetical protein